ncbi:MAG TPA: hypothetical protein VIT38_02110 [Allosphingosinicella sp.]
MKMPDYEGYVAVFGNAFRQIVDDRIAKLRGSANAYDQGYLMGLQRAVTLMRQIAQQCEIPSAVLGVADIDETEFVRR